MKVKLLHEVDGLRTFAVVLTIGDEAVASLGAFAVAHEVTGAGLTAIGAFSRSTVAYFDWEAKSYERHDSDEQVEVLALIGDIATTDDGPAVHAHAVLSGRDGSARGGHLLEGHVRPTLEVIVTETPAHLRKSLDPESGLMLIDLDREG